MTGRRPAARAFVACVLAAGAAGCLQRPPSDPGAIVVSVTSSPNNLDPRLGTDDTSQKLHQLIFDNFMELDERLRVVPHLAERLDRVSPTRYVAAVRRGVRFHDGHELTADDVVFTFRCFIDPECLTTRRNAFGSLASVEAQDRYTVVFTLREPFPSFPSSLVMPVVPAASISARSELPIGTGPYRFVRHVVDDRLELAPHRDYFLGAPRNAGLIVRVVPDEVMRGLELRKGTIDLIVNDVSPDIVHQLRGDDALSVITGDGADYQYIGLNLRDPILADVRVRRALAHGIDRAAIVAHLRRGLAQVADGVLPPVSWARAPDLVTYAYDPVRARALLDEAGYADPDGEGPASRFRLALKVSNVEFNRLQSAVIQHNLREIGVDVDVRTYEFATLYADVLQGSFQMFTLQWTAGSLADPDILRQLFHSRETPPAGFNRGFFADAAVDRLLEEAASAIDTDRRLERFAEAQRRISSLVPYISLWHKTNFAISRRSLSGVRLTPLADFRFLREATVRAGSTN
jgi:peptide/nickel transport system substrate-binding protein